MNDTYIALAIVALAALMHASFQLGVSMLTLLSGHSLSVKRSQLRTFRLTTSFVFGASVMTILLLSTAALIFNYIISPENYILLWSGISGLLIGVGLAVWFTYYRSGPGTSLWLPRGLAEFLTKRTKSTRRSAESFSLGMTSVLGELLFIIAPLAASAHALVYLPMAWQIVAILGYATLSLTPLLIVWAMVGYGRKISRIQQWRERYKHFLQFIAATGLIILGAFIYVNEVLGGVI